MIKDINVQHELLKTALAATDAYLAVEGAAVRAGQVTTPMLRDFTAHYNQAWKALESLGVLSSHEEYMKSHLKVMSDMSGEEDTTLADDPFTAMPGAEGGVDESVNPYNDIQLDSKPSFKAFKSFFEEKKSEDDVVSEEDIAKMVDELEWDDIADLYNDDELVCDCGENTCPECNVPVTEELISEKLSAQARIRKRQAFARMRGKRNVARNMKLRRASSTETLKKRAVLAARRAVYARFLKGRDKSSLSAAEKDRIEQQVKRMKFLQTAIATKMLPKMRAIEQKRIVNYRTKK
jgi:hypothetical protein